MTESNSPSWHQPSTVLELVINKDEWDALSDAQRALIDAATKAVLGAIGVSGLSSQEDEDLSRLGMQSMGL